MITTFEEFKIYNQAMKLADQIELELLGKRINAYINTLGPIDPNT